MQDNIYTFLMFELDTINDEFSHESQVAHQACVLFSCASPIPETFFRLYSSNLDIDDNTLNNAIAYFAGSGFLDITCDCDRDASLCDIQQFYSGPYYDAGCVARKMTPGFHSQVNEEIEALSSEIL